MHATVMVPVTNIKPRPSCEKLGEVQSASGKNWHPVHESIVFYKYSTSKVKYF